MSKWIEKNAIENCEPISQNEVKKALEIAVSQVKNNLGKFSESFPGPASRNNFYDVELNYDSFNKPDGNEEWTAGFWTGEVWISYENSEIEDEKKLFKNAGDKQVDFFLERINRKYSVHHHDMGFLYSPSCVAAYKLTGNEKAKEAAIKAADQLMTRYQPIGEYLQAWGKFGARDNTRFIIDCLLNIPLLFWASEVTGDEKYKLVAKKHIHTTMKYIMREDNSCFHTIFMNPDTGEFSHGATCQGYRDNSAWARGQTWGIYGSAIAYKNTGEKSYIDYFRRASDYYLKHLPSDLCPYWDLMFGDGDEDEQPRDSSSAAIAACGFLEMSKYLNDDEAKYYRETAARILKSLYDNYQVKDFKKSNGQLLHGVYAKKTPYNTCKNNGVDECVIWGDYFYMEALNRLLNEDWNMYW